MHFFSFQGDFSASNGSCGARTSKEQCVTFIYVCICSCKYQSEYLYLYYLFALFIKPKYICFCCFCHLNILVFLYLPKKEKIKIIFFDKTITTKYVPCDLSCVICHISLTLSAIATDPPCAYFPTRNSRVVRKDSKTKFL